MTIITGNITGTQKSQFDKFAATLGSVTLPRTELLAFADALDFGTLEEVSLSSSFYDVNAFSVLHQLQGKVTYAGSGFVTSGWDGNPLTLTPGTIGLGTVINTIRLADTQGRDLLVYRGALSGIQIIGDDTTGGSFNMTELQVGSTAIGAMILLKGNLTVGVNSGTTGTVSGSVTELTMFAREGSAAYQFKLTGNFTPNANLLQSANGSIHTLNSSVGGQVDALEITRIDYTDSGATTEAGRSVMISASGLNATVDDLGALLVALQNPYGPDLSFGQLGHVTTTHSAGNDFAQAAALQADGKIVVAGTTVPDNVNFGLVVARYNSDGSLDDSFSGDGKFFVSGSGIGGLAGGVAIYADGRILVGGGLSSVGNNNIVLMRLNADGSPDNSFSGDGLQTVVGANFTRSIALQTDGKILVLQDPVRLTRFNSDGSVDTGFGTAGSVTPAIGFFGVVDIKLQGDGKILIAGNAFSNGASGFAVARLNADGSLDTSFNGTGFNSLLLGSAGAQARSLAIQANGQIVVTGGVGVLNFPSAVSNDLAVVRFNGNGSVDNTFGFFGAARESLVGRQCVQAHCAFCIEYLVH